MPEPIEIRVDGRRLAAECGANLAVVLLNAGVSVLCRSPSGEPRGPVCAMGVCFECSVLVRGRGRVRACRETVTSGMEVQTGA